MSDILINGITYSGINSVQIPLASGDGNATYSEGGGGGNAVQIGSATPVPNLLNLFHVLETGACVTGEFMAVKWVSTDEQLLFDSGLETLNGFAIIDADTDHTTPANSGGAGTSSVAITFLKDGVMQAGSIGLTAAGGAISYLTSGSPNAQLMLNTSSFTSARVDGGKLYVTPKYTNNANYNGFYPDHKYIWVAW